jgi:hypothetical protein
MARGGANEVADFGGTNYAGPFRDGTPDMRRHQAAQTICREMERVLCVRALGDLALEEGLVAGFGAVRVLETRGLF